MERQNPHLHAAAEAVALGVGGAFQLARDVCHARLKRRGVHSIGSHLLHQIDELQEEGHFPRAAATALL